MINLSRRDHVLHLVKANGIAVELGVAEGVFSERALGYPHLGYLYSVDRYSGERDHTDAQYLRALRRLQPHQSRNTLMRCDFATAAEFFETESLDFIYVDGYAHDAQQGGSTLETWYPKVRSGGIISGDDYHTHHSENQGVIDRFCQQHGLQMRVINCHEPYSVWSEYPTWYAVKQPNLLNARVALVGNSQRLFEQSYGSEIDAHDLVIRMNRCTALLAPDQYQDSHGSKLDIWAMWRLDEYENEPWFNKPRCRWQMAFWYGSKDPMVQYYKDSYLMNLIDRTGLQNPSTGLMVLDWVSQQKPALVNVYGFDWKRTATWTDPNRIHDVHVDHNFAVEQQYCANYFSGQLGYNFK